jgi:hypothetical protein
MKNVILGLLLVGGLAVPSRADFRLWLVVDALLLTQAHQFGVRAANADKDAARRRDEDSLAAKTWQEYYDSLRHARKQEEKAQMRRQYRDIFLGAAVVAGVATVFSWRDFVVEARQDAATTEIWLSKRF